MHQDHYQTLGVLNCAEDIVITAAYKALAKKYHPDTWKGERQHADAKMVQINIAYDILSNADKRKGYDAELKDNIYDSTMENEAMDLTTKLNERWQKITAFMPHLEANAQYLSRLSPSLEYFYKLTLIETKEFNKSNEILKEVEDLFLTKYFSKNPEFKKFAKELLLEGNKKIAKDLNEAISIMGQNIDPAIIIDKITNDMLREGNIFRRRSLAFKILQKNLADFEYLNFLRWLHIQVEKKSGIFSTTYCIKYRDRPTKLIDLELKKYVIKIAEDYIEKTKNIL